MNRHLTQDELIDHLYGIAAGDHLAECPECAGRWKAIQARRRVLAAAAPVSTDLLAAQRRAVYSRLEERPSRRMRWLPAVAAAGALAIVALVYRPAAPRASHPEPGDAQLFSEVYSMEQSTEPSAAAPIHGLFEDNSQ